MSPQFRGFAASLPPKGAQATMGNAVAPSWPEAARREA